MRSLRNWALHYRLLMLPACNVLIRFGCLDATDQASRTVSPELHSDLALDLHVVLNGQITHPETVD